MYENAIDIKCLSHTTDLCGGVYTVNKREYSRIEGPTLADFYIYVNGLFTQASEKPNMSFAKVFGKSPKEVNSTNRWWIKEEFFEFYLKYFWTDCDRDITLQDWVKAKYESGAITTAHMTKLYNMIVPGGENYSAELIAQLKMDLAIVVDITKPLRELTYTLEGDGPVALMAEHLVKRTRDDFAARYESLDYPNIRKVIADNVAANVAAPDAAAPIALEAGWIAYGKKVSEPCVKYFHEKVVGHPAMDMFAAASLANPWLMRSNAVPLTAAAVRQIVAPLLNKLITPALLDRMIGELGRYQEKYRDPNNADWSDCSDAQVLDNIINFWKRHALLPAWREYAFLCYLLQPSSACVERAFSMLKYIYGEQQAAALVDLLETTLMLRYNRQKERHE
jgi:hypothetical protein